jgi:hypothetical protein
MEIGFHLDDNLAKRYLFGNPGDFVSNCLLVMDTKIIWSIKFPRVTSLVAVIIPHAYQNLVRIRYIYNHTISLSPLETLSVTWPFALFQTGL